MLIGQSILAPGGDVTIDYYSPWYSRAADAATFLVEVLLASGGTWGLDVLVQHKKSEDADSAATTAATFTTITAVGTSSKSASGLKELVRYKYSLTADSSAEWIHFRANPPIWQPN